MPIDFIPDKPVIAFQPDSGILQSNPTIGVIGNLGRATDLPLALLAQSKLGMNMRPTQLQSNTGMPPIGTQYPEIGLEQFAKGFVEPAPNIADMQPGVGRALASQVTPLNVLLAVTGLPLVRAAMSSGPLGHLLLASVMAKLGISGAQDAGTSAGTASAEPPGGQRREDIVNAGFSASQMLPLLFGKGLMKDLTKPSPIPVNPQDVTSRMTLSDLMEAIRGNSQPADISRQLPAKAQSPLDVAREQAQAKLEAAVAPKPQQTFIASGKGIAPESDAVKVADLTRPVALLGQGEPQTIEQRLATLEQQQTQPVAQPPVRVSPQGVAITPEQNNTSLPTGIKQPLQLPERALSLSDLLKQATQDKLNQAVNNKPANQPPVRVAPSPSNSAITPEQPNAFIPNTPIIQNLRPAIKLVGTGDIIPGKQGQTHNDIIAENNLGTQDIDRRIFVDNQGNEVSREQAAQQTQIPTEIQPGNLHSSELAQAQEQTQPQPTKGVVTPNAETIRNDQNQSPQAGLEETGRGEGSSGDVQQTKEEGAKASIGQGLNKAVEKNEQGEGGFVKFPGGASDLASLGFGKAKVAGEQLFNRIKNRLGEGSTEFNVLVKEGLKGFLAVPKTTDEVQKWIESNGPKVEVKKLVAGNKASGEEVSHIQHKMETKHKDYMIVGGDGRVNHVDPVTDKATFYVHPEDIPNKEVRDLMMKYRDVYKNYDMHNKSATSRYTMVNPKPLDQMPGAVDLLVKVPIKGSSLEGTETDPREGLYYTSSHYPTEGKNLIAHVRGYMETINGKKVFRIFEVQSDWGQSVRERQQRAKEEEGVSPGLRPTLQSDADNLNHPLLRDYNRLALKAAIDHARAESADAIVIDDAETAMMTEGHDLAATQHPEGWNYQEPEQAKGMRLNYDQVLPRIAEDLTGEKGQRVEMGEHQNAVTKKDMEDDGKIIPRKDLIFKNSNGTPKTASSGLMFPIEKANKEFSLFGSDKVKSGIGKGINVAVDKNKQSGSVITEPLTKAVDKITDTVSSYIRTHSLKQVMAYMKDATSGLAAEHANEDASRASGVLGRAIGNTAIANKKNSLPRQALTFMVESEGSRAKLNEFKQKLINSTTAIKTDKAEALRAINYAIDRFDSLKNASEEYSRLVEQEAQLEESAGRSIERRKGYVMHLAEDTGDATSFIHAREFDTMADRIAAGVPKGSLDAIELLRARVARGQQAYVQSKVFVDNVKRLKDNETNLPIVGDYVKVPRGNGKPDDVQVPKGYKEIQMGYHKVPVLDAYADTLHALTAPSWLMQHALGRTSLEVVGAGKHVALGLDTFHLVRLGTYGGAAKIGTGHLPWLNVKKGVTILDNSAEELKAKAASGEINPKNLLQILEAKRRLDLGIKTGYNIQRNIDAFNQHWTEKIPVSGHFQNWLFNTFQRGVMADVYSTAWDVYKAQMPKATDAHIARKLSNDLNEVFGTIGRQGLIKSRTGQDVMRLLFLAPQWTEGRAWSDLHAITGSVKAGVQLATGKRPELNMQSRVVGSMILMYLIANQAINYVTTGHSTFENKDGHQLAAFIPDIISGSKGYWLNATANAEEIIYTMDQSLNREGGDAWQAWLDFAGSHLSTLTRPLMTGITGRQWGMTGPYVNETNGKKPGYGGPSGNAKFDAMVKDIIPSPIGSQAIGDLISGKPNASTEKRLLSSVGLKVNQDQQPQGGKKKKQRYSIVK